MLYLTTRDKFDTFTASHAIKFDTAPNGGYFVSIDVIYRSLLPVGLILGIGIGFLGSSITVRRHIKV